MSTYEAVIAAPDTRADVLAARLGVSERTVYRYKTRSGPPKVMRPRQRDAAALAKLAEGVKSCNGSGREIRKLMLGQCDRRTVYFLRERMLRLDLITADDWPLNRQLSRKDERLLLAMVKAGATPRQIGRCFSMTAFKAAQEIKQAWVLINLGRRDV